MLPIPYSVILDLETLDTDPHSVVFEIGALTFERTTFTLINSFEAKLDIPDQLILGRTFSTDTLAFHQSGNTLPTNWRGELFKHAFVRFWAWLIEQDPAHIWIQGKDFDHPILKSCWNQVGIGTPFPYHKIKCSRDTWDNAFPGIKHDKRPHRALPDALATLRDLATAAVELKLKPEAL